jgi:FKBP-type peptidyl-prolyl cis-trans isomerase
LDHRRADPPEARGRLAYQEKPIAGADARSARAAMSAWPRRRFLAAEKEKGARKLSSGLIYQTRPAWRFADPKDEVKVHYVGKLRDGTVFDSSRERGEPALFPLPRMVPCWREGLVLMKPGGSAVITCPADRAYGDTGVPPGSGERIPPGAALQFEVELISVQKGAAQPAPTAPNPLTN